MTSKKNRGPRVGAVRIQNKKGIDLTERIKFWSVNVVLSSRQFRSDLSRANHRIFYAIARDQQKGIV